MRLLLRLWWIVGMLGCAGRRGGAVEVVDPRLSEADRLWENRERLGLGPAERAVSAGLSRPGDNAAAWRWRQARLLVERGRAEEDAPRSALDSYAAARSQALRCLEDIPGWSTRRAEVGLDEALALVDAERAPCVAWGALAWARWIAVFGVEPGALDLEPALALARAGQVGPESDAARKAEEILVALVRVWEAGGTNPPVAPTVE